MDNYIGRRHCREVVHSRVSIIRGSTVYIGHGESIPRCVCSVQTNS